MAAARKPLSPTRRRENSDPELKTVAEVYTLIGWGTYQSRLFIIAGVGFASDAIETAMLAWLEAKASGSQWPTPWDHRMVEEKKSLLAAAVFAAELIGCFFWGPIADRWGRKLAFGLSNLVLLIFGVLSAFAPDFASFVVMRGLVGLGISGIIIPFDNLAESVESHLVVPMTFAICYWWSFGTIYINGIAPFVLEASFGGFDPWRVLTLAAAIPIFFAFMGYWFVEESPLWLQETGREEEALVVLKRIAKLNGKELDANVAVMPYSKEANQTASCLELVKPGVRRRTFTLLVGWSLGVFGYYGASLSTPVIFGEGSTDGAEYGQLAFASSGEILGVYQATHLSKKVGTVRAMSGFMGIAALCTASLAFLLPLAQSQPSFSWLVAVVGFLMRAACNSYGNCLYVATPLAYHTHVRATANGFHYGISRFGAMAATIPIEGPNDGLIKKLVAYTLANSIACLTAYASAASWNATQDLTGHGDALASDLNASSESKRESSFARSGADFQLGETSFSEALAEQPQPLCAYRTVPYL